MKLRRRDIIKQRQQEASHQLRKAFLKKVNIGLVAFASGNILTHLTQDTPIIKAMEDPGSQGFSKSQFLDLVAHSAQLIAGENDLYASVMIAQAALESGWGNSGLASAPNYNLFGIKGAYNDQTVVMDTLEDDGSGHYYQITDGFKKYNNYTQSLQDYAKLLTGNHDETNWRYNYYYGARKSQTNSYQQATAHLTGRYATDTSYAQKLNRIIRENNLTRYDVSHQNVTPTVNDIVEPILETQVATYEVQAGDTYWAIAKRYNVSVAELQSLNNDAAIIYPGQQLALPQAQVATYEVQAGDTYWAIAKRYNVSVAELQSLNNDAAIIYPGQQLALPQAQVATYEVQAGDTYWAIAKRYNVSVAELQSLNNDAAIIYPGQQLVLPQAQVAEPKESVEVEVVPSVEEEISVGQSGHYTVKPGDTMWRIAHVYGMNLEELKRLNNTTSSMLQVGQRLQVNNEWPKQTQDWSDANVQSIEEIPNENVSLIEPSMDLETQEEATLIEEPVTEYTNNHVVQAGDTLYSIAKRNGLDVYQLIEENGSTNILPGQVIEW